MKLGSLGLKDTYVLFRYAGFLGLVLSMAHIRLS
jgi:hypothetical protein